MSQSNQPVKKLYLCNGKKYCSNDTNSICYMNGGTCHHTSDESYRMPDILINGKPIPTTFDPFGDEHLVERINYIDLIKERIRESDAI